MCHKICLEHIVLYVYDRALLKGNDVNDVRALFLDWNMSIIRNFVYFTLKKKVHDLDNQNVLYVLGLKIDLLI